MMIKYFNCNSFAMNDTGGNPAGVVVDAPELTEEEYITIAKKVGFSETAFIFPSKTSDFKIRFFSPVQEVDLCGHATIASFHTLFRNNLIHSGNYQMETKAGNLLIEIQNDGKVFMNQPLPTYYEKLKPQEIAESLNIHTNNLLDIYPIQIVSTGLKDIIIPIKSRKILDKIQPDFDKIAEISQQNDVVGYHLFSFDNDDIYCRNFAPLLGIDEESATGTASGALASYLFMHHSKIQSKYKFYQGFSMHKDSLIEVALSIVNDNLQSIKVGGLCKGYKQESLQI